MIKRLFFIVIGFVSCHYIYAQGEANIWYFGQNAGLDFNSGTPVLLFDGVLDTQEGCASISDNDGNLLFYTDGVTVYNRLHNPMPNGTDLNGSISSTHSAIIVPKPDDDDIYYIFTIDVVNGTVVVGLQYSEVNMTLDGGLGGVTSTKNIPLDSQVNEKITAIQNANSDGYWVVAHRHNSDEFIVFEVTSDGVSSLPNVISVGSNPGFFNVTGQIKISPDNSKLAVARGGEVQLFDFDNSTGSISNPQTINNGSYNSYGIEFSSNGNILYVAYYGGVNQYNLLAGTTADIIASEVILVSVSNEGFASMQIAPDGKIYIARTDMFYLDFIDNPNILGTGCGYNYQGLDLGGRRSFLGLPTFVQSFFNVAFQVENACLGESTSFSANIPSSYDSLEWNFGDGITSANENPSHTYSSAGTYTTTLTVTVGGQTSISNQEIIIYEQPTANPIANQILCDDNNDGFEFYDLTQHANDVLGGQDPNQFELTYYDGIFNYNNGIPIPDIEIDNFETLTGSTVNPVISIHNVDNPDCKDTVTFQIQVFEGTNPSQNVPMLSECDNTSFGTDTDGIVITDLTQRQLDILNGQSTTDFTVSYYTDIAFANEILTPAAYQNTNANETIYVLVENTNSSGNCIADTSFQLEVLPLPTVTPVVSLSQCDDDTDGFSVFNLTEVNAELSSNYQSETITFHESFNDADMGISVIPNATTYSNATVSTDVVWARIESTNGCHRTAEVNLVVSTTQIPLTFIRNFYACDDLMNQQDGISAFDFSSADADIRALFPVGQQLVVNYYRNEADALSELNPIADITNYRNIGYPNTQNIYARVDSTLDNDCLGLGQHITLTVETVPIANTVTIAEQCDGDGDNMYAFDTSTIESQLLNGQTNIDISYTDANGLILPSPLPNPFLTGSQLVTARLTNSLSQDSSGQCFDEIQLDFRVQAAAVANTIAEQRVCDDDDDGFFNFDTSTIEATLLNGQTGMIVSYIDANGMALASPLPNPFFTDTQTITARVENQLSSTCFDETTINFIVDEVPIANTILNDFVCDDVSNDGEELFTLSDYNSQILGGQSSTTFEVFYFDNPTDVTDINANPLPDNYLVNSVSTPVFARIQNRNNANCFATTSFQLGVNILPIAATPSNFDVCDDDSNDGEENFILSDKDAEILNGLNPNDFDVKYYLSITDAEQDNNQLPDDFTNTENPQTIYVRLENNAPNASECFTTTQFEIFVREQPVLLMDDLWPICEGETVDVIADAGYDNYSWSNGEMTRIITVDAPQTLTVRAWNDYDSFICETEKTITVTESNIATITNIETIDWTQSENSITVTASGNGDYEYSLNDIFYQDSNIFSNLVADEYTVYVRDKLGCGTVFETVYLLNYPIYFTPNGDGNHDRWQIINGFTEPRNVIHIFNRYGKLLKQLSPTDIGWDGTYNGNMLPTSDYWFNITRQDGKTYTGHFTLKR